MVSIRCKIIVQSEVEKLGLHCLAVELGEVEIKENISAKKLEQLNVALQKTGLELLEDQRSILVEKIRNLFLPLNY